MKKNKLLIFIFILASYQPFVFSKMTDGECLTFFKNINKPDSKIQLAFYDNVTNCSAYLEKNTALLEATINSYRELFKVNRSHNHLEPFISFYKNHTIVVDKLVQKISDKDEREDFMERLKLASREFSEGNGH